MASTQLLINDSDPLKYKRYIVAGDYGCTSTGRNDHPKHATTRSTARSLSPRLVFHEYKSSRALIDASSVYCFNTNKHLAFSYSKVTEEGCKHPRLISNWPGPDANSTDDDGEMKIPSRVAYAEENNKDGEDNKDMTDDHYGKEVDSDLVLHSMTKMAIDPVTALAFTLEDVKLDGTPENSTRSAVEVTADYLRYCYERVVSELQKIEGDGLHQIPITWVMTYPSCYSIDGVDSFKGAVSSAGIASRSIDQLEYVLEADAAAHYCLTQQESGITHNGIKLIGHGVAAVGGGVGLVADLGVSRK